MLQTYARWLPPVLLAVVAVTQLALARTGSLTPWKGGGVAMFSTLEHAAYRGVRVAHEWPARTEGMEMPLSLEADALRAAAFPADWLLRRLAEGIVARERRNRRAVTRVTLTAWATVFD